MSVEIKIAEPDHLSALSQLLIRNHLAADDLPDALPDFWLAFINGQLVGSIGIEIYGTVGLLRSVCVDPDHRKQRIAQQLYQTARQSARQQFVKEIYLLTTTADRYFENLGFERIERSSAPECIQLTTQFSSLCPSSAIVMKQTIRS